MSDSLFSQKGPGQVPRGIEQQAVDANPSQQPARIGTPVWKSFVSNKEFQENNAAAIQAEQQQMRESRRESAQPIFRGAAGKLIRKVGRQVEELNPEEWADDPVAGPEARKSLWDREIRTLKKQAEDDSFQLRDPSFHAKSLSDKEREDMLAEGGVLQESDPRHAELKARLAADDEYRATKTTLAQRAFDAEKRARELESVNPDDWWQSRTAPKPSEQRAAVVAQAQAERADAVAADNDAATRSREIDAELQSGVTGERSRELLAEKAEIAAGRGKIAEVAAKAEEPIKAVQEEARGFLGNEIAALKRGYAGAAQAANILQGPTDATNAADIAKYEAMKEANPQSKEFAEFMKAEGFWESAKAFAKNPVQIVAEVMLESAAQMVPSLALGAAGGAAGGALASAPTAGGAAPATVPLGAVIGSAVGAGSGSFLAEYGSSMIEAMQEAGMDAKSPESIQQFFADPDKLAKAREFAVKRGVAVGVFDAVSAGLAGKFMKPVQAMAKSGQKVGTGAVLAATGKEIGAQAAAGATGEAAGQLASRGEIQDGKSIFLEGVAEVASAPIEVATNLREFSGSGVADPVETVAAELATIDPEAAPPAPEEVAAAEMIAPKAVAEGVLIERELAGIEAEDKASYDAADAAVAEAVATGDTKAVKAAEEARDSLPLRAPKARAVLKIAAGKQLDDLTEAELSSIGAKADKTGFEPMTAKELKEAGLTRPLIRDGADGSLILTDEALKAVEKISPRARSLVKMSEAEALAKAKERTMSEWDVPMRDGTMQRVRANSPEMAEREAAGMFEAGTNAVVPGGAAQVFQQQNEQEIDTENEIPPVESSPPPQDGKEQEGGNSSQVVQSGNSGSDLQAGRNGAAPTNTGRDSENTEAISDTAVGNPPAATTDAVAPTDKESLTVAPNATAGWQTRNQELGEAFKAAKGKVDQIESAIDQQRQVDSVTLPPGFSAFDRGDGTVALQDEDGNDIAYPLTPQEAATRAWSMTGGDQFAATRELEANVGQDLAAAREGAKAASDAWNGNGTMPEEPKPAAKPKAPKKDDSTTRARIRVNATLAKLKKNKKINIKETTGATRAVPGEIQVNPDAIIKTALERGMNDEQAGQYFDMVLDEEIRHLAQFDAAETLWKLSKSTQPLKQWREAHYAAIWQNDFVTTGKDNDVEAAYGKSETGVRADWKAMDDWQKAMEGIRIMSQTTPTENAKLWTDISDTLKQAIRAALASLKKFRTPALETEITNLENALRQLTDSSPDSKKPAPGKTGAGDRKPAKARGDSQPSGDGEAVPARRDGAGSPVVVGSRVEFERDGRKLTGIVTLKTDTAVRVRPDEDPAMSFGVPIGEVRSIDIQGPKINKEWTAFAPESGTLGIPRAMMPQIKSGDRSALVQFLKARGVDYAEETIPASSLKPTQTEFSPAKVAKAKAFEGGNRSILISSDNHVLDGHHQWLAARDKGEEIAVIRLDSPIRELLPMAMTMPSVTVDGGKILEVPEVADKATDTKPAKTPAIAETTGEISDKQSATITFPSRAEAQEFAKAWGRFSLRGHDLSSTKSDGTTSVTVYDVTPEERQWIDGQSAAPNGQSDPKVAEPTLDQLNDPAWHAQYLIDEIDQWVGELTSNGRRKISDVFGPSEESRRVKMYLDRGGRIRGYALNTKAIGPEASFRIAINKARTFAEVRKAAEKLLAKVTAPASAPTLTPAEEQAKKDLFDAFEGLATSPLEDQNSARLRLSDIANGKAVTLFHGSKRTDLKNLAPNSSLTLSESIARKFAGSNGRLYSVQAPVPANNPSRWEAGLLLDEVSKGIISESDALERINSRASEIRINQELPISTQSLATSPLEETYRSRPPSDRLPAFQKAAQSLIAAGVETPESLAAFIEKVAPGRFRPYSEFLWRQVNSFLMGDDVKADWDGIYGRLGQNAANESGLPVDAGDSGAGVGGVAAVAEEAPQVETVTAPAAETKAAKATVKKPDTNTKKLKAQKEYLLAALDKAIQEAPEITPEQQKILDDIDIAFATINRSSAAKEEKDQAALDSKRLYEQLPKIEIEVPGDGTFRIVNAKPNLRDFRKKAATKFPTSTPTAATPKPGPVSATAITPLGKPKELGDFQKIVSIAVSKDVTRRPIMAVHNDGENIVATDGRRALVVTRKTIGSADKPANLDPKTMKPMMDDGKPVNYPNWKQVIPTDFNEEIPIDTAVMQKIAIQAAEMTSDNQMSVYLWRDASGKLGLTSQSADVGMFAGGDIDPDTAKFLVALNSDFFSDGLAAMRRLGFDKVKMQYTDEAAPIVLVAPDVKYVLMPMRANPGGNDPTFHPLSKAAEDAEVARQAEIEAAYQEREKMKAEREAKERERIAKIVGDQEPEVPSPTVLPEPKGYDARSEDFASDIRSTGIAYHAGYRYKIGQNNNGQFYASKTKDGFDFEYVANEVSIQEAQDAAIKDAGGEVKKPAAPAPKAKPTVAQASEAIKAAYPYMTVKTASEERKFITKAKANLEKLGIKGWQFDSAIESAKTEKARNANGKVVFMNGGHILRELLKAGDVVQENAAVTPTTPAGHEIVEMVKGKEWHVTSTETGEVVKIKTSIRDGFVAETEGSATSSPGISFQTAQGWADNHFEMGAKAPTPAMTQSKPGEIEYRGFKITKSDGVQIGYQTSQGRGKGRKVSGYDIADDEGTTIKFVDTLKEAKAYVDSYIGDQPQPTPQNTAESAKAPQESEGAFPAPQGYPSFQENEERWKREGKEREAAEIAVELTADIETFSPEQAASELAKRGITVEKGTTKTGKPVWEIKGKTFDVKDALKTLGAKWYGPKKSWSIYSDEDPTAKIANVLAGKSAEGAGSASAENDAGTGGDAAEELRLRELRERLDATPDGRGARGDAIASVNADTATLIRKGLDFGMPPDVVEDQIEDIAMISRAFDAGKPMFLLGNGAGTGKTFVLGGAIRELRAKGTKSFVYVTMNQDLIDQIKNDLREYGVSDVSFHTYSELSTKGFGLPSDSVLIFDESHNVKNADSSRGSKTQPLMGRAKFTIIASATPFENPVEAAYLAGTGVFNEAGGHTEWGKAYGASVRKYKAMTPEGMKEFETLYWLNGKLEDGLAARQWFVRQGIMVTRPMRLPLNMVDSQFSKRPAEEKWVKMYNEVEQAYESAMANYRDEDGNILDARNNSMVAMHMTNTIKRILEASKVNHAVEDANKILADGGNVVIFVETKADRWIGKYRASELYEKNSPLYTYPEMREMHREWEMEKNMAYKMGERPGPRPFAEAILEIARAMHDAGIMIELPSVEQELVEKLGGPSKVGVYTGSVTNAKARADKDAFLAGKKKVIVATMAKGGTGLSLHDKVGNRPTFQININLPWKATGVDQVSGRVARYGLQSKAFINWLFADNIPFERSLANRVGRRMRDMGALVKGIDMKAAKVLTDDFDFEGSADVKQDSGEVAVAEQDIFEQAERLEKSRRQRGDQSNGFFETPFPLAALMTQISGTRGKLLDPSAGRGNLIRFTKNQKKLRSITAVELRSDNADYLEGMTRDIDGAVNQGNRMTVKRGDFMELADSLGLFNTIHMNPPFERKAGVGWQDMAHVMKAFSMLTPDGRLVAIVGEGGFFRQDKQSQEFRQFLSDKGATVIKLPEGAFKNSGTGVRTRMIVLDQNGDAGRTDIDLSDMDADSLRSVADAIPSRDGESLATSPLTEENTTFKRRIKVDPELTKNSKEQQTLFGKNVASGKLAGFGGKNSRLEQDIVDAEYEFRKVVKTNADAARAARARLKENAEEIENKLLRMALGEDVQSDAADQLAFQYLINDKSARAGDNKAKHAENAKLRMAYRLQRGDIARELQIGYDRSMSPAERAQAALTEAIYTPSRKVQEYAKKLTGQKRLDYLAAESAKRLAEVEAQLKKMGATLAQVTGQNQKLQLENTRLGKELLKTRNVMEADIIKAVRNGWTMPDIQRRWGKLGAEQAMPIITKARQELYDRISEMSKSGMTRDQILEKIKEGLATSPLGASNGMTPEEIWNMIENDLGIPAAIPTTRPTTSKPKPQKAPNVNPLTSDWSRPEFTDGLKSYTFDTKDREGIMERVEIIRGLAGAVGKIDALKGDKQKEAIRKLQEINAILKKYGTDATEIFNSSQSIEDYRFDLNDIAQVAAVSRAISMIDADIVDKASEWLYFSMLSGLQTMLVNATAIVPAAWESAVGKGVEMAINSFVRNPMGAQLGEEKYVLRAIGPALTRALSNARTSFAAQHPMFDRDVMAQEVDWERIMGGKGYRVGGSISGKLGDRIRIPMRILAATDDFNTTLMAMCEVGAYAYRVGVSKGMKPGSAELDKFIRQEVNTPGSFSYQLAAVRAKNAIFSNPLPGQTDPVTGKKVPVNDLGDAVGYVAGKITETFAKEHDNLFVKSFFAAMRISFFPFQRTPFNILRKGIRYTLNPFSLLDIALGVARNARNDGKWDWKITGDDAIAMERRMERANLVTRLGMQLQGGMLMLLVAGLGEGDEDDQDKPVVITGSSPFTPRGMAERMTAMDSGVGPYRISFRRADGSERFGFNYGRIEPMATTLAASIDIMKQIKRADRSGKDTAGMAGAALGGFVAQAQDKSFLRGVGDLISLATNAIAEPDLKDNRKMQQFVAGRVAMAMPNIIKQPIREMDSNFRERSEGFMQELLYQTIPAGQKPARVDAFGQTVEKVGIPAARIIDIGDTGTNKVNPVASMLLRYRDKHPDKAWFPSAIRNATYKHPRTGKEVEMTAEQLAEFRTLAGRRAAALLKSLKLNTENPTERDIEMVKKAFTDSRSAVKKALVAKYSR